MGSNPGGNQGQLMPQVSMFLRDGRGIRHMLDSARSGRVLYIANSSISRYRRLEKNRENAACAVEDLLRPRWPLYCSRWRVHLVRSWGRLRGERRETRPSPRIQFVSLFPNFNSSPSSHTRPSSQLPRFVFVLGLRNLRSSGIIALGTSLL